MKKLNNFWIFKEELDEKELNFVTDWFGVSRENPRDLCKEQFDAWLEEDDAAFESLMQETMGGRLVFGHLFGYLKDFRRVLKIIQMTLQDPNNRSCSASLLRYDGSPSNPKPNYLTRFWFEFFFKKIGKSVYDFAKEGKMLRDSFIHLAARHSQLEALKYCLDNKVDINKQVEYYELSLSGITPLMRAVDSGATEAVDFLLQNGANPYIKDEEDCDVFDYVSADHTTEGLKIREILEAWIAAHSQQQ